jgi:acyl-CoA synthetase (AMP-forming)/AMP-acid ligase II/thioesterase domain-containing protein
MVTMGEADATTAFRDRWRDAAQQHADRPAVRDDERVLTYSEFDALLGAIGAAVAARVPVGGVVGVVVPKRVWSLAAMLGVANAARTALLLDPDDPPERWRQHCTRVDATVVLAESASAHDAVRAAGLVPLGADDIDFAAAAPDDRIDLDCDAWILCTSGSTGVPKLVAGPQRMMAEAWVRNVERNEYYGDLGAAVLVLPPLWSAAIRMAMMQAFCGGACAVLVDTAVTPAPRLLDLIETHDVHRLHLGPWLLRTLLDAAEARAHPVPAISLIVSTGAPLTVDDVERTWKWFPNARIRSHYGSTEVAGIANIDLLPGADLADPWLMAFHIDANARVRVLDDDGVEVPAGEQGDLWVWSSHTRGSYRDAPELDRQSLMVDADGAAWFRTGDLGRIVPDGRVLVEGRNDTRVKVNGLAVDLLTVTAAVRALGGVGDAEVSAVPRGDDTQLVAWIVADRGAFLSVRDLRAGLAPHLPRFMFPHVFRAVSTIPRLPTGKVDRMALRAAAAAEIPTGADAVAPETPNERVLASLFETVLERRDVGVHESFFELGGDSLAALQLVEAVVDRFAVADARRPALESALMTDGTVASLARVIEDSDPPDAGVEQATLRPDGVGVLVLGRGDHGDVPIVLLPGGGQDPLGFRPLVRCLPGRRVWTLTPRGFRSRAAADRSVEQIATRFADALLDLDPNRVFVVAGFSFGGFVAHALAVELAARGAEVRLLAILDAAPPGAPLRTDRASAAQLVRHRWRQIPHAAWWRSRWWYLGATAGIVRRRGWVQGEAFMSRAGRVSHRFRPQVFAGPALVVRSAVDGDDVAADLGWGPYLTGEVSTVMLPGNHFGILLEPSVAAIGERLAAAAVAWRQ